MKTSSKKLMQFFFRKTKHKRHKNMLLTKKTGFYKCKFKFSGKSNQIKANDSIFYKCSFHIFGSNNTIEVGTDCLFKNVDFWIEGNDNYIFIGNKCTFSGKAQLACLEGTKIMIGDNALVSSDVNFRTGDSHGIFNLDMSRINNAKDIKIGNNVWICQKATLLKGCEVSNNSVVALGAVVTKKFENTNCIIGGNPAKIVKTDIIWKPELKI